MKTGPPDGQEWLARGMCPVTPEQRSKAGRQGPAIQARPPGGGRECSMEKYTSQESGVMGTSIPQMLQPI